MSDADPEAARLREALLSEQERQRELVRHFRNVLAVVRALVRRPADENEPLDDYRATLDGRIGAFARAQSALLHDIAEGTDLESLLRDELLSFGIKDEAELRIEGPETRLGARATGLVALAVHELALNHVERGKGGLSVSWCATHGDSAVEIVWADGTLGGRALDWLERAFTYDLKGSLTAEHDGKGRRCTMVLPRAVLV